MQAAETVYEFGSSPDEDDDNPGQTSSSNSNKKRKPQSSSSASGSATNASTPNTTQQLTRIAGTHLHPNKASSTSIDQKLNTSFGSISDNYTATNSPSQRNPADCSGIHHNISASEEQLLIRAETESSGGGGSNNVPGYSSLNLIGGSISNTSNTSLSSATNSSRGNISQSGNQSVVSASSMKSGHHQQTSVSSQQQNPNFDSNVISERVKNLATQIYQELKRIISRCNYDEDILSGLMPLIVRVLESLDLALIENQQLQVELELCKDDNEQLVIMFEKEKAAKRAIDKKLIESEYAYEEERQQYQQKIESLDSTVKMYELKAKNASDQATRFEEKESERKKDYNKLHDRYTELLKSHCDIVERFRHLVGSSEVANLGTVNVPHHMVAASSDSTINDVQSHHLNKLKLSHDDVDFHEKGASGKTRDTLKSWTADTELTLEDASLVVIDDMVEQHHKPGDGSSHNESDRATSEPEGEHEKESENDSIAYTSMEKEFRKLIQENKDLLNTKNALNVVKDDLIAEVDRLTNEVSMYEQAVEQLNSTKDQMKQKVSTLDTELRKTKEELEKAKQKIRENNEEGVPYSQRKRFGRAEMAKVLMERNNYKERFMELQDAVRYTELVRANRMETEKRSGLWKFFSNLFGAPPLPSKAIMGSPRNSSSPVISYNSSNAATLADQSVGGHVMAADALQASASGRSSTSSIWSTNQRLSNNTDLIVLMDSDLNIDRSRATRESGTGGRLSVDSSGYIHAYGWSLRASSIKGLGSDFSPNQSTAIMGGTSSYVASDPTAGLQSHNNESGVGFSNKLASLQVPIPQYCRPLTGDSLGMKIWCATAIDLSGGDLAKCRQQIKPIQLVESQNDSATTSTSNDPDTSGSLVNISTSTPIKSASQQALKELEQEVRFALNEQPENIASSTASRPILKTTTDRVLNALPYGDDSEELSTFVWICSTQHSRSKITIIDIKNKPNELLDSFYVPTFLYCCKSIPGCKASDLLGLPSAQINDQESAPPSSSNGNRAKSSGGIHSMTMAMISKLISAQRDEFYRLVKINPKDERRLKRVRQQAGKLMQESQITAAELGEQESDKITTSDTGDEDAEISRILDNNSTAGVTILQKLNDFVAHTQPQLEVAQEAIPEDNSLTLGTNDDKSDDKCKDAIYYQPISTHLSTVWMGGKDSVLYIHSAIGQWKDCIACVELQDSILQICHHRGRVFVALANGSLCVFFRNSDTKQWEFSQYLLIDIALLNSATSDSLDLHGDANSNTSSATLHLDTHSKLINLSQEDRQSAADIDDQGSADTTQGKQKRSDSTKKSKQTKVSGVHCLEIANKNLWLGYRNRIFVFDPITLRLKHTFNVVPQADNQIRQVVSMEDGVFICLRSDLTLRLYSSLRPYQHVQNIDIEPVVTRLISPKTFVISHITAMRVADNTLWIGIAHGIILTIPCKLVPQISEAPLRNSETGELEETSSHLSIARFVPKCDINNAQISFHGHRDAVKFFVHAHNLMLSGGQGYLDFRIDMDDQSKAISDKSHLILWQLPT